MNRLVAAGNGEDVAVSCAAGAPTPRREFPCDECPVRRDNATNPRSKFPAERWESLAGTVAETTSAAQLDAQPFFACHKGPPGHSDGATVCAGWLAAFGWDSNRVRVAVIIHKSIPASALDPGRYWPPLYETWNDMVTNQTWRPGDPDDHLTKIEWK